MSSRSQGDLQEPLLRRPHAALSTSTKPKQSDEYEYGYRERQQPLSATLRNIQARRQWVYFGAGAVFAFTLSAFFVQTLLCPNPNSAPNGGFIGRHDANFPRPSEVGYRGPTGTGIEPFVVATAVSMPKLQHHFPVDAGSEDVSAQVIFSNSGNLAPPRSIPSWGLPDASEKVPDQCSLDQVHILHRHGQRYPTQGTSTETFARKLKEAANFEPSGQLAFLKEWNYPLGIEILTPAGRLQLFQLGVSKRFMYGQLLDRMKGRKPVFRTTSQDRMLHSALNFAAGFFGIPSDDAYHQEIIIEEHGGKHNNTLVSQHNCPNEGNSMNRVGFSKGKQWAKQSLSGTAERLQPMMQGVDITYEDVLSMLYLCSYETVALGYSAFCPLFTQEDFEAYGYYFDIVFHYNYGFGSPVSSAVGIGWVEEVVSRLTGERITTTHSSVNTTLSSNPITFPLDQSIYVDASHDTSITAMLVAMNFTSLGASGPLPTDHIPNNLAWHTADITPFATALTGQVMTCEGSSNSPSRYIRWLLNDGVLPLDGVQGCPQNRDGLCALSTWVDGMKDRISSIDFRYDCFAEYEASDQIVNGRPPHKY